MNNIVIIEDGSGKHYEFIHPAPLAPDWQKFFDEMKLKLYEMLFAQGLKK